MVGIEVGQLAVKIAGRDAGKKCLIIDIIDDNFVLIDGATRRRKCNIKHLEFLPQKVKIKKGASHKDVISALRKIGINVKEKVKRTEKIKGSGPKTKTAKRSRKKK